jgi:hypothetical protein
MGQPGADLHLTLSRTDASTCELLQLLPSLMKQGIPIGLLQVLHI